jgi:aminoglycoside phosphotransferase (APT) family kinase protein
VGGDLNDSVLVKIAGGDRLMVRRPRAPGSPWLATVAGQLAAHRLACECGVPVAQIVASSQDGLVYRYIPGQTIGPGMTLGAVPSGSTTSRLLAEKAGATYGLLHARHGRRLGPIQPDGSAPGWAAEGYSEVAIDTATRILRLGAYDLGLRQADLETAAEMLSDRRPIVRSRFIHGDASPGDERTDRTRNRVTVPSTPPDWLGRSSRPDQPTTARPDRPAPLPHRRGPEKLNRTRVAGRPPTPCPGPSRTAQAAGG